MIVTLEDTDTRAVSKRLVALRNSVGAVALGRVMTLLIVTDEDGAEKALDAAAEASRQHPSRIITLIRSGGRGAARMDAQIRVGGDAGASEIVVCRLYGELASHSESVAVPLMLADSPVVAWWPGVCDTDVAGSPIGRMAIRRITDVSQSGNPPRALLARQEHYAAGDTDMAWSRTTRWRGLLATALDQPPYESVESVTVCGAHDSASTDLLAGWLAARLRCPVQRTKSDGGSGIHSVQLDRASGPLLLTRASKRTARLTLRDQPDQVVSLHRYDTAECLAEELRRLDADAVYREALVVGMPQVAGAAGGRRPSRSKG
ncbi:glucose-6-phosphate dehydrogenase assembly protein OpcA [Allobranchiibius sp. CTAmp26]|uniref:glucose-6-phosphate dehydrogenase assembly protein OpcA n=1 Tax=Allobranchiibius sp. CTAmp26 TaxID=2815214 RepID=UPI001AA18BC9|nr:glucose-6-phosphate dehydrogenase assembly protein OpcA [Allobranchiibius sp. CTAmp26]MBO1754113.1 glucose-6-phosphate dehydrogenase assembly protein OpcA [Allobranchiibius sp. CTAmp26]